MTQIQESAKYLDTANSCEVDIVRRNPGHPAEDTESVEEEVR